MKILIALMGMLLAGSAHAEQLFFDRPTGFQVLLPDDWLRERPEGRDGKLRAVAGRGDASCNVGVRTAVQWGHAWPALEADMERMYDDPRAMRTVFAELPWITEVQDVGKFWVGDHPGALAIAAGAGEYAQDKVMALMTKSPKATYIVRCVAPDNEFQSHMMTFLQIISSFRAQD